MSSEFFHHLRYFADLQAENASSRRYLVYAGDLNTQREGVDIIPWNVLGRQTWD